MIKNSITRFPWEVPFRTNSDPNWQAKSFTEIILNIMSNFVPYKVIKVIPRDPPLIDGKLKKLLNRQKKQFRNYKRHGFQPDDKARVDIFREECNLAIQNAKINYLKRLGNELANPRICQKIINN